MTIEDQVRVTVRVRELRRANTTPSRLFLALLEEPVELQAAVCKWIGQHEGPKYARVADMLLEILADPERRAEMERRLRAVIESERAPG
ncbi:MAG: hypothetical protein WD556_13615 [Actinomycetota bacterium]